MKKWHRSRNIFEAFSFAFRGLKSILVREHNLRIQIIIGTLVVCTMFFFRIPALHMAVLVLAITLVITLEMINTSFELISDMIHPEYSEIIRNAKDIAAGAVLLANIGACIVGILILLPVIMYYA